MEKNLGIIVIIVLAITLLAIIVYRQTTIIKQLWGPAKNLSSETTKSAPPMGSNRTPASEKENLSSQTATPPEQQPGYTDVIEKTKSDYRSFMDQQRQRSVR